MLLKTFIEKYGMTPDYKGKKDVEKVIMTNLQYSTLFDVTAKIDNTLYSIKLEQKELFTTTTYKVFNTSWSYNILYECFIFVFYVNEFSSFLQLQTTSNVRIKQYFGEGQGLPLVNFNLEDLDYIIIKMKNVEIIKDINLTNYKIKELIIEDKLSNVSAIYNKIMEID